MSTAAYLLANAVSWTRPFTEPVLVFATVLLILVIAPFLSRRLKAPEVIAFITAGILAGPHGFHLLNRSEDGAIVLMGKVGLIYIMLMAGLEINLNDFLQQRNRSLVFGGLTFTLPMVLGTILGLVLFPNLFPSDAVLMGSLLLASTIASHTLLAFPTVSKLGIGKESSTTTAVGGTIVTDTLALLLLAVIAAVRKDDPNAAFWAKLLAGMGAFVLITYWVVPRVAGWYMRVVAKDGKDKYVFTLAIVFACAVGAMTAGMEDIIGAFFAGLAINRLIPHNSADMERISFVGESIFIPMFLLSVGMLVDWRALLNIEVGVLMLGLIIALFIGKAIAAWLTQKIYNYDPEEGFVIFSLSVAQAAATIAAVFVGMEIGLFDERILNASIGVILISCIVSSLVAERYGKRVLEKRENSPFAASVEAHRILIPLANPNTTESLMSLAILLNDKKRGEPLYPLTVTNDGPGYDERVAQGEANLERAEKAAAEAAVPVKTLTKVSTNVPDGIKSAVVENRIRTVLIGWNGKKNASDRIFGTILDRLTEQVSAAILVYRYARPLQHRRLILVIPPLSERLPGFLESLHIVQTIAEQTSAKIHTVCSPRNRATLEKIYGEQKPTVDSQWTEVANWRDLVNQLSKVLTTEDLCLLITPRQGSAAHEPRFDKDPSVIAEKFPTMNLITLLPNVREEGDAGHAVLRTL